MLPVKSYEPEKICPIFEKGGKSPKISGDLDDNHTFFRVSFTIEPGHSLLIQFNLLHYTYNLLIQV